MQLSSKGNRRLLTSLERLDVHDHICLIYENKKEQFDSVIPFISIGLKRGDKNIYIADDNTAESVLNAMRKGGIEVNAMIKSGALMVVSKQDTYLKPGYFDPDAMIKFLKETAKTAKTAGYRAIRITGEMTWSLSDTPGVERLIEYEAKLNYLCPGYDCLLTCQYNRNRFSPQTILDIIHTHPLVISGGYVCKNFYYTSPIEFLQADQPKLEANRVLTNIIEREQVETKIERLNLIVRGIRNVNQLITKEKDKDKLLQGVCSNLIETRGYYHAWIVLFDKNRKFVTAAESGLAENFLPMLERLKNSQLPDCVQSAFKQSGITAIINLAAGCSGCSLVDKCVAKGVMTICLEHAGKTYGLLTVAIPPELVTDKEEQALFKEVACNIAFALYNMGTEKEKQKIHGQFLQSQKMESIGQLAGGIAHDLNNIISVIMGYTEISLMELLPDHPLYETIATIKKQAERATELTNRLLTFGKKQTLQMKNINLNDLISELKKFMRRTIQKNIEIEFISEPGLKIIKADPAAIEQILLNLCINARDAMPEGGNLRIKTKNIFLDEPFHQAHPIIKTGNHVLLEVSDNGMGMDEETRQRIFEPFFTTKQSDKGTGLGLAIVYGLVNQHKGVIEVDSQIGKGTTFKIYLPVIEQQAKEKILMEPMIVRGGTETILVSEDDEELRKMAENILTSADYRVFTASGGEQTIKVFNKHSGKIDLVILDMSMPKKGGTDIYNILHSAKPDIKVLFTRGYSSNDMHDKITVNEDLNFIRKPFNIITLKQKVREILDR